MHDKKDHLGKVGIVGEGTTVKGDIKTLDNFRIEGFIIGNVITGSKLFLSETGRVEGDIQADTAEIRGQFKGTMNIAGRLILRAGSVVTGNIQAEELMIDEGAELNGNVNTLEEGMDPQVQWSMAV